MAHARNRSKIASITGEGASRLTGRQEDSQRHTHTHTHTHTHVHTHTHHPGDVISVTSEGARRAASCGDIGFGLDDMLAAAQPPAVLCVWCVLELKVGEAREAARACKLYDHDKLRVQSHSVY